MNQSHNPPNSHSPSGCSGKKCGAADTTSGSPFGIRGAALAGALGLALASCQPRLELASIYTTTVIYGPAPMLTTRFLLFAKANSEQQQIAAHHGRNAAANRVVKQKISSGQARKAAVVVPPKDGNSGGIMKVDPATGRPESDMMYRPGSGVSFKTGDVIVLGGTRCVLYGRL